MSLILDTHRKYLSDQPRLAAYRKAIEETVQPGDLVVDLGSGTGILGLMACRAGASHVYAIEAGPIIGLARAIAADNGFGGKLQFLRGYSKRIEVPEKVDIIITDQIGRLGFEAGVFQYFQDAIRRFLKPGGRLLPSHMELWAAPVNCQEIWDNCEFWRQPVAGLKFGAAYPIANNTGYPITLFPEQLLAEPQCAAAADLQHADPDLWRGAATFEIGKQGVLHGLGGWFRAQLSRSVSLTNSPLAADRINRRNVFMPFGKALAVNPGDRITVKLHAVPSEIALSWSAKVETGVRSGSPQVHKFNHSTMLGMLLSREDLEKTNPESFPRLTPWGEARRTVVDLIDGRRCLGDVEKEVQARHPELFPSMKEAAVFVAEVVTRYTV